MRNEIFFEKPDHALILSQKRPVKKQAFFNLISE